MEVRNMKRLLSLALTAALILSLTACGGGNDKSGGGSVSSSGSASSRDGASSSGGASSGGSSQDSAGAPAAGSSEPEPEQIPVYELVESKIYSSTYTYSDFVLDENGRVLEKKVSGSDTGTYTYEYDAEGHVIAENFTARSGSYDNYTYTYNEFGLKASAVESSSGIRDGNTFVYEYEYDEQNRPVKMTWVNTASDNYSMLYTYEYDENGNVAVETQTTYADGLDGPAGNSYEIHHTYDAEGRVIKSVSQKAGESSTNTSTYTYDCVGYYTAAP